MTRSSNTYWMPWAMHPTTTSSTPILGSLELSPSFAVTKEVDATKHMAMVMMPTPTHM
jgi:hypothetical protein